MLTTNASVDEAARQARYKLEAIEDGRVLVSQTCAAWLVGVTPQAILNRRVEPLFVIDNRKFYRLADIHGHNPARVADALHTAWTISIDGIGWVVAIMPSGRPVKWDEAARD